ncbi:Fe-S cluster assembly protein NifU [Rhodocyclus tenuis]|uniref:Nitrogen fixation protein NifU n=2 Tax=Rhodocyclus TaxID=1064 RepID=A0A6L5JY95_RHOTE|nr:Fe-S cluster assembly protein NifU [Rhodocyclus gracilis]MQY52199.1 Fe-S cluster assembly protein NifU [Rhodocyclus gracilis]MRD72371.1 Fe-S cluster assembly protein NifU [Rhodocyclus gracilis]NJA89543.1 Fe-S cluster assembly protein NifU [Rhodocyclus gracilis]
MWDYSDKVREHFFNPRNAGLLDGANAVGDVGSIKCGDALRLMLKVDPASERILDASFQTFGCGSAIASSSALTEMVKGKTLDEALTVSNQDIADFLDGLPPEKMHCSVMGREALQAAVANYRGEAWQDAHAEGALVCKCFAVDSVLIEDVVRANGLTTVEQVSNYTKAGGGCASCHEGIEEILAKVAAERCTAPTAETKRCEPAPVAASAASPAPTARLTNFQRMRKIEETVESIRPMLQRDHGDIEIVEVDGKNIYVNLKGACQGCMLEASTLNGIQTRLVEELGEFVRLLPASMLGRALS